MRVRGGVSGGVHGAAGGVSPSPHAFTVEYRMAYEAAFAARLREIYREWERCGVDAELRAALAVSGLRCGVAVRLERRYFNV